MRFSLETVAAQECKITNMLPQSITCCPSLYNCTFEGLADGADVKKSDPSVTDSI